MNYIKQTDTFSCGPVALINARIFQGYDESKALSGYQTLCLCKPPNGTKIKRFWTVAQILKYDRIYKPTIEKLNAILDSGNAVIINHGDKKRRHYSLIISRTATKYDIVNHYCGATITPIKVAKFERDVWRDPKIWVVRA